MLFETSKLPSVYSTVQISSGREAKWDKNSFSAGDCSHELEWIHRGWESFKESFPAWPHLKGDNAGLGETVDPKKQETSGSYPCEKGQQFQPWGHCEDALLVALPDPAVLVQESVPWRKGKGTMMNNFFRHFTELNILYLVDLFSILTLCMNMRSIQMPFRLDTN